MSRVRSWSAARPGANAANTRRQREIANEVTAPMSTSDLHSILTRLGLEPESPGAWSGSHGWSASKESALLNIRNPADGTLLAQVRPASADDYENVIS